MYKIIEDAEMISLKYVDGTFNEVRLHKAHDQPARPALGLTGVDRYEIQ